MRVTFSVEDEVVTAIDTAAATLGATRSGWISNVLRRAVGGVVGAKSGEIGKRARRQKGDAAVFFRMSAEELRQVEIAAKKTGLTRTQFFIACARGRVWRDQTVITNSPDTKKEMREAIRQLNAIGVNLNQAVRVLRGAVSNGNGMMLDAAMKDLADQGAQVERSVRTTRSAILAHLNAEQDGWRWK